MIPSPRDVAHQILGVICRAGPHSTSCDRVTSEIVADRAAFAASQPAKAKADGRKIVCYVAGRFRAPDGWCVAENIRAAERVGFEVAKAGAMPLIPHANTASFAGTLTDQFWLDGTMELLRRCDAVMTVDNWRESEGALAEINMATALAMPVFSDIESLRAWLRAASS